MNYRRLLSSFVYLAVLFLLIVMYSSSACAFESGTGTESDPYMVYTAEDLIEVGNYRNSSVYFEQGDDIDLYSVEWKGVYLYGNYNGNGFSISNLQSVEGLFSINKGTIKNVKIEQVNIIRQIDPYFSGGISRYPSALEIGAIADENEGIIENCYVKSGRISTYYYSDTSVDDYVFLVGGIAGSSTGTIRNCVNAADINIYGSFSVDVGGICGSGGIIEHCLNTGDVYAYVKTTSFYRDGICWVKSAGICDSADVYDSANTGNVTSTGMITYCSKPTYGFYSTIYNDAYFIGGEIKSRSYCSSNVACISTIPNDSVNCSSSDYIRSEEDNVTIIDSEEIILYMWSDILNLKKPDIPCTMTLSGGTDRYAYVGGTGVCEPGDTFGTSVVLYFSPGTTDYTGDDISWKSSDSNVFVVKNVIVDKSGRNYACYCYIYAKKNGKAVLSAELPNGDSVSLNIQVITPLRYDIQYGSDVYYYNGGFYSQFSGLSDCVEFYFSFNNMASDLLSEDFGDVLAPIKPITITATISGDDLSFSKEGYQNTYSYTTDTLNAGRCVDDLIMLFPYNLKLNQGQKNYVLEISVTSESFDAYTEEYQFTVEKIVTNVEKHIDFVSESATYRSSKMNMYGKQIVTLKNDKEYVWSKFTTLDFENYSQVVFADLMVSMLNVSQAQLSSPLPTVISDWVDSYGKILSGVSDIVEEDYKEKFDLSETNIDKLFKKSKYTTEPEKVDDELRDTVVDLLGNKYASKVNGVFAAIDKTSQVIDFIHLGENVLQDIIDWGNKITVFNAYVDATKEFKTVIKKLAETIPESERGMKDAVNDYVNYDNGVGGQVSEVIESFSGMMGHITVDVFNSCIGKGMVKYLTVNLINWSGATIKIGGKLLNATNFFPAIQSGLGAVTTGISLGLCLSDILCDNSDKSREMSRAIYMAKYTPYIIETLISFENELLSGKAEESVKMFENAFALHKAAQSYVMEHTINSCKIKAESIIIKLFGKDDWNSLIADITNDKNQMDNLLCHYDSDYSSEVISKSKVIIVECPVDVYVYDSCDKEVFSIVTNSVINKGEGFLAVISDGDKFISLPSDQNYTIKIIAYDSGEMDYSVYEYDQSIGCTRKIITKDIALVENKEFVATVVKQNDEPSELFALKSGDEKIEITEEINVSQSLPDVNSYFWGYIRDLYARPYTNSKYQYRGDRDLLYALIKPYMVAAGNDAAFGHNLYSLRGGIGSNDNPYLSYYYCGNVYTDAKAVVNHYKATYGANLNRMQTINLSSGTYEINVFKTVLGLIDLLYLPVDSYNYSAEEYKEYLADLLGISRFSFDLMNNDDIEVMQQLAFWYVAQSDEYILTTPTMAHISKYPADKLIINGDNDFDGYRRRGMNDFYTQLIVKAIELGEKYEFDRNSMVKERKKIEFNKNTSLECNKVVVEHPNPNISPDVYYKIGPFDFCSNEDIDINQIELFDATDKKIERLYEFAENSYVSLYKVYNENLETVKTLSPGNKYFIHLEDLSVLSDLFPQHDITFIKIRISGSEYVSSADYISASGSEQDLIKVSKRLLTYSDEIFASIHSLEIIEEVLATCNQTGYKIYRCSESGCSYEYKYDIDKTEHNLVTIPTKPATCVSNGATEGLVCADCGFVAISPETLSAIGHSEIWYSSKEPTCSENGISEGSYCEICNSVLQGSVVTPKKEHTYSNIVDVAYLKSEATCKGRAMYFKSCSVCGEKGAETFNYGDIGEHAFNEWGVSIHPTCTANGSKIRECVVCGYTESHIIPAVGHNSDTVIPKVVPTCTNSGLTEGKKCTVCGTITTKQQTIAKLDHTSDNGTVIKSATCATAGTRVYKCMVCKTILKSETLSATGKHNSNTIIPAVAPTYTSTGLTTGKKCSVCGKVTVAQQTIAKLTLGKATGFKVKDVKIAKSSEIKLAWNKVSGAEEYEVYQYVSKKWKKIKTTSSTSYTAKKLKADKEYKFKVRAVVDGANGAYSSVLAVETIPEIPSKLTLKTGKKQLAASWKAVSDISGYEVQYSTSKKFSKKTTKTVKVKKSSKKTTIKKLSKGKKYYVRVRTYKTVNGKKVYSGWSTVKNVKVK